MPSSKFATVNGDIDLSPTSITINYDDATLGTMCGSFNIPASLCESDCACVHVFNISLSLCQPTVNINITGFVTNIFGNGPPSEPIMIG